MITYFVQQVGNYVAYGLSTDTKPENPPSNCLFIETDTAKMYKVVNSAWVLNVNTQYATAGQGGGNYNGDPTVITQDATHRFATDEEKSAWNGKQDALGFTPVATNDARLSDARTPTAHSHDQSDITGLSASLASKQDALVSATNIKTVNGSSLLGSGNLVVSSSYTLVAKLASNQATGANVTPVVLTGLVFNYEANSTYRIDLYGAITSAVNTTGCGFQLDVSTAVTTSWFSFTHQLANTGTYTGGSSIADNASAGVSSGTPSTNAVPVLGGGLLITGANSGTCQLMFRSETTAVTTCNAGTTMVVEKLI